MRRRGGFTIIELMLVIGIIGVLATVAIPTMLGFKLRSKLSGKRVVIIHTGQNIDRDTLRWALGMFDA